MLCDNAALAMTVYKYTHVFQTTNVDFYTDRDEEGNNAFYNSHCFVEAMKALETSTSHLGNIEV